MKTVLDNLCEDLDFQSGSLYSTTDVPTSSTTANDWLEKGSGWLPLIERVRAKYFFRKIIQLLYLLNVAETLLKRHYFLIGFGVPARPRILFLTSPGEISILDLGQKPISISPEPKRNADLWREVSFLAKITDINNISRTLSQFHRDNLETGKVFEDKNFERVLEIALIKALIRDLKLVREELILAGLSGAKTRFAHALIGRSIFIRYLEDRKIITGDYFSKIGRQN